MAAPKPKATTTKAVLVKKAPPGKVNTAKVARATGFTTGNQVVKATKSNPVTTSKATAPGQVKKAAGVQSAKTFAPGQTKAPSIIDHAANFIQSRVNQMTGKTPTPISGAMKNKTPVIPYTQKNIKAIQKARP